MVLASVSPALPICYLSTSPTLWLTSSVHSLGHSAVDLAVQGPPTAHSTFLHGSSCMSSCKRAPLSGSPSLMPVNCQAGRGQTSDLTFAEQSMRCYAAARRAGRQGGRAGGGRRQHRSFLSVSSSSFPATGLESTLRDTQSWREVEGGLGCRPTCVTGPRLTCTGPWLRMWGLCGFAPTPGASREIQGLDGYWEC